MKRNSGLQHRPEPSHPGPRHVPRPGRRTAQSVPAFLLVFPTLAPDVPARVRSDLSLDHRRVRRRGRCHQSQLGPPLLGLRPRRRPVAPAGVPQPDPGRRPEPAVRARLRPGCELTGPVPRRVDAAAGRAVVPAQTTAAGWFDASPYSARFDPAFAGTETGFNHAGAPNAVPGPLEITPHGSVHVFVGGPDGKMSDFNQAAADPIFWLHHANLDRLWEVWRSTTGVGLDPTGSRFVDRSFEFWTPPARASSRPAVASSIWRIWATATPAPRSSPLRGQEETCPPGPRPTAAPRAPSAATGRRGRYAGAAHRGHHRGQLPHRRADHPGGRAVPGVGGTHPRRPIAQRRVGRLPAAHQWRTRTGRHPAVVRTARITATGRRTRTSATSSTSPRWCSASTPRTVGTPDSSARRWLRSTRSPRTRHPNPRW